jgi:hypothetical protein
LAPNNAFGPLPEPVIPNVSIAGDSKPTFDLSNGQLPRFPDTVLVYNISLPRVSFDTLDKTVRSAGQLGFTNTYQEVSSNVLRWQNPSGTRSLEVDNNTGRWQMRTQYFFDTIALLNRQLNTIPNYYGQRGVSIASQLGFTDDSFNQPPSVATFARLGTDGLFTNPLTSASANYVVVDIYRNLPMSALKPTNQLNEAQKQLTNRPQETKGKVYKADPRRGAIRLVVGGDATKTNEDVFAIDFQAYRYSTNYGIYSVVTPQEAITRLQQGKGSLMQIQLLTDDYFGNNKQLSVKRFVIEPTETELAYFEGGDDSKYTYPIYVFKGRVETNDNKTGRFVFYVDALQRNLGTAQ